MKGPSVKYYFAIWVKCLKKGRITSKWEKSFANGQELGVRVQFKGGYYLRTDSIKGFTVDKVGNQTISLTSVIKQRQLPVVRYLIFMAALTKFFSFDETFVYVKLRALGYRVI